MRTNQPVTQREVEFRAGETIVSCTDTRGIITRVNPYFLEISGYSEAESVGQPHNYIRHPDMPPEAFADLWKALKEGRTWSGIVKNRCKNGDHYWVRANVAPIRENGQITGFMSVRTRPERSEVEAADNAYRLFREKRAQGLAIEDGKVVRTGIMQQGSRFMNTLSVKARITLTLAFMLLLTALVGGVGFYSLQQAQEESAKINDTASATRLAQRIQVTIGANRMQWLLAMQHDPTLPVSKLHDHPIDMHTEIIERNFAQITEDSTQLRALTSTLGLGVEYERYLEKRTAFVADALKPALQALREGRYFDAAEINTKIGGPRFDAVSKATIELNEHITKVGTERIQTIAASETRSLTIISALLALGLLAGLIVGAALIRTILNPLATARHIFARISEGDYSNKIDTSRKDELGDLLDSLAAMQTQTGNSVVEMKRINEENARIRCALDNVSTGVMIADTSRTIIYANHAVQTLLKNAEADIRKQLPNFDASRLLGVSIDQFHKNPAHQAGLLERLSSAHTGRFEIGGRSMQVTASPIFDGSGKRLGAVAEWLDRTLEVAVEKEIESVVEAAARGDFGKRIGTDGKQDFFLRLAQSTNRLLDTSNRGLLEVARVLQSLADGDLTQRFEGEYEGLFAEMQQSANSAIGRLAEIIGQLREATDTIHTAAREIATGNADLSSRTESQAAALEETAASMDQLTSTVKSNADNARQADQLARGASDVARRGGDVVGQVVTTMGVIADSSKKIADIISVIDGIAFQTNILALNAAVEAARAGEQGRGFAVVAGEVRNLAQRSAGAAREIKQLIENSVSKVEDGYRLVEQAGTTMDEIVESIRRVSNIVGDISSASDEQSQGIEQVNTAVTQMDESTQQNAALVEEAAAAAESMQQQADQLAQAVAMFRLNHLPGARMPVTAASVTPRKSPALAAPSRNIPARPGAHPAAHATPRPGAHPVPAKAAAPTRHDDEDEWEEF